MNRPLAGGHLIRRLVVVVAMALALPVLATQPTAAATPGSGTLSYAHPSLSWSGTGMTGSANSKRTVLCNAQATACDNFSLHFDVRQGGVDDRFAVITLKLTPSDNAQMTMLLYGPGCDPTKLNGPSCYAVLSNPATIGEPVSGDYVVQVACAACAGASYTVDATLAHIVPNLPARGDASQVYKLLNLPTPDASKANTAVGGPQLTGQFGEPAIWLNRNGYGVVNTFGPTVWVTRDGGKTFSDAYDIISNDSVCPSGYAGDADAVTGIDNTFYADNLCVGTVGGINNEVFVNQSGGDPGTNGANWTGPYLAGGDSDRQWIAPDPVDANILYFSYHDLNQVQDIEVYKSIDKGHTWTCPATGAPANAGPCPAVVTAGGGPAQTAPDTLAGNVTTRAMVDPTDHNSIYMPYADAPASHSATAAPTRGDSELTRFRMAVSHDGGATWNANSDPTGQGSVVDANDGSFWPAPASGAEDNVLAHIFIASAMDTKGGLYALFSLRLSGATQTHIYLVTSTDHGATWSTPHQVDSGGLGSNVFPAIAVGDPGRVALGWYGSLSNDFNDPTSLWSMMEATTTDALSARPHFDQVRMSSDLPVHSADICQAGTLCAVTGGNRNLADYQTGTIDPCGMPVFVYTDDHRANGETVVARQTSGTNLYTTSPCAASAPNAVTQPTTTASGGSNGSGAPAAIGTPNTNSAASSVALPSVAAGLLVLGLALRRRRRGQWLR
jgi:hypothetical protein